MRIELLAAALLLAPATAHAADGDVFDPSGWTLTFGDDFRYLDASPHGPGTAWITHTPWNGDFGDATFADPSPDGPFGASRSGLTITASKGADGRWRSGLLCSRDADGPDAHGFAQRYGYFEMRAKFPPGEGVWPAFWLIGTDKSKYSTEIDVVEYYGKFPDGYQLHATVHREVPDPSLEHFVNTDVKGSHPYASAFHTYGVRIDPTRTRFYFDRHEVWNIPTLPEYRQPLYVLVNLALGGGWPIDKTPDPSVMMVDYVRVWRDPAEPATETLR